MYEPYSHTWSIVSRATICDLIAWNLRPLIRPAYPLTCTTSNPLNNRDKLCNRWRSNVDASPRIRGRFYRTKRKFLWQVALGQCKQVLHYLTDVSQGWCRLAQEYTDASIFGGTDSKCQAIRQSVADMTLHVSKKILPSSFADPHTEEIVRDA